MSTRQDYIDFLSRKGLSEADVLPIWPEGYEQQKTGLKSHLQLLARQGALSAETVERVIGALDKDTNDLLQALDRLLREQFAAAGEVPIPPAFIGVFPTNSFNGQAVKHPNGPLILLKTGCIEILEAAANYLLAERSTAERVRLLVQLITGYVEKEEIPSTFSIEHPSYTGEAKRIGTDLVTAAETFVLCHEYGHLASGHFDAVPSGPQATSKGPIDVFATVRQKEYEADLWALQSLVKLAAQQGRSLSEVRCGVMFFFGIALLIESYLRGQHAPSDGHPTAIERIAHAEQILLVYGSGDNAQWDFITTAHLSLFNLVHKELFGTTLPWESMSMMAPRM